MKSDKINKNIPNKNLIKGAIRRLFTRSPNFIKIIKQAVHKTIKGKHGGKQYICNVCNNTFPINEINVDHIVPIIRINETIHDLDYNTIVDRIFCTEDNLQVICKQCHNIKNKSERKLRKKLRTKNNNIINHTQGLIMDISNNNRKIIDKK